MASGALILSVATEHVCNPHCDHHHYTSTPMVKCGSALIVPKPPDYSTPAKVTARARERGSKHHQCTDCYRQGAPDFKRVYKAFRAVVSPFPCRVEDTHRPRWEYRQALDGSASYPILQRRAIGTKKWAKVVDQEGA